MSTLEQEQALLLDRDLKRRLAAAKRGASAQTWLEAARALSYRSMPYLAAGVTEKGLASHPTEAGLWVIHIQSVAISPERLQDVAAALEKARRAPKNRQTLLALVDYYLEKDKEGLAKLEAVPVDQRDAVYHEVHGCYAMARQEYRQAVKAFAQAQRLAPRELRLMVSLGRAYSALGETSRATRWLYRVVTKERHYVQAWESLLKIHLERGDLAMAKQAQGMALSVNPRDWGLYFTYADAYLGAGRYSMARAVLNEVLDLEPREVIAAEVHNYLGYLHYLEGRYPEALPQFRKALELNPSLAVAWFNLGNLHFHLKEMEEAKACFQEALKADPFMASAACQMGLTLLEQGILEKARPPLEKALALDSSDYWAHLGLSEYHRKTKNPVASLEEARQALRLNPDDANVHNYLGIALETNRRYFDAEKAYRRALELDPLHRWAANNLGYLYEKIMRVDPSYKGAAVEAWRRRLLICRDTNSSVRGAINHLEKLGVPTNTIRKWLRDGAPARRK